MSTRVCANVLVISLVALAFGGPAATAAPIVWTGDGDATSWHDPDNWNLDRVPTAGDAVSIPDVAMTTTVEYATAAGATTIDSLISAEAFVLSGGALTIDVSAQFDASFNLTGGEISGAADIIIAFSMTWSGGTMSGAGTTSINNGATLTLTSPATKTLQRSLDNDGTTDWTAGDLQIIDATINNLTDGEFNASAAAGTAASSGTNAINNAGTFNRSGAGTTTIANVALNNTASGAVNVIAGTLRVDGGGTNFDTIDAATGATLAFGGSYTHDSGSQLTGEGALIFDGGTHTLANTLDTDRTITVDGGSTLVNLDAPYSFLGTVNQQNNATISGTATLTVVGGWNWASGTMSGSGSTTFNIGSTLTISSGTHTLMRDLDVSGTTTWTGGDITITGVTFDNLADGVLTLSVGGTSLIGTGTFANAGTFNRTGAGTTATGCLFNNSGTVNLTAGTLDVQGGGTNSGVIDAAGGTTLRFSAGYTHGASSQLNGTGELRFDGGTHTLANTLATNRVITIDGSGTTVNFNGPFMFLGTINQQNNATVGGTATFTVVGGWNWASGTMSGSGTTRIASGASLTLSGSTRTLSRTIENHGVADWTSGAIGFVSATFDNESDGEFNAVGALSTTGSSGASEFNNAGTFNRSGAGATTFANVDFNNSGTLDVQAGDIEFEDEFNQTGGTTLLNGGAISTTTSLNLAGGGLAGAGNITGTVANLGGTVSAGASPGVINILGNYIQGPSGTLDVEIGGLLPGTEHDQLNVSGSADFDGTINISLLGGFEPNFADTFNIVPYANHTGAICSCIFGRGAVNGVFDPNFGPTGLELEVIANYIIGDFDCDADVDTNDFAAFIQCFGGGFNPPAVSCPPGVCADFDFDGDVDLSDFATFTQNFTGAQ